MNEFQVEVLKREAQLMLDGANVIETRANSAAVTKALIRTELLILVNEMRNEAALLLEGIA